MDVLLFEDAFVPALLPLVWTRCAYDLFCAGSRLADLLSEFESPLQVLVRPHLRELATHDRPHLRAVHVAEVPARDLRQPTLLVNARLAPTRAHLEGLKQLLANKSGGQVIVQGEQLVAAWLPRGGEAKRPFRPDAWRAAFEGSTVDIEDQPQWELIHYPHDLIRLHLEHFAAGLHQIIFNRSLPERRDGVFVAEDVVLEESLVTDTREGPIVIESGVTIGPHGFLRGPVLIGANSRVNEHASLKRGVALAHTVRVGGELEASVLDAYANKQHFGFLGHSYLGSWVNLGAGTCNSNLKNTYGTVRVRSQGKTIDSGMRFLGAMVGDYSRTAITTSLFTGLTIGVCSMLYGFVTQDVPSYANFAKSFGSVTGLSLEVMLTIQKRAFARRGVQPRACDEQLLRDIFNLTKDERAGLAEGPPQF